MSWETPKTDWDTDDGIMDSDFNRIEENIEYLYDNLDNGVIQSGSINDTLSGFSVPPSITIDYRIEPFNSTKDKVSIHFPEAYHANSNSTSMGLTTALPSYLRPPATLQCDLNYKDEGDLFFGYVSINTVGVVSFVKYYGYFFSSSGSKGIYTSSLISYLITSAGGIS